jgi:hypothetical protein
MVSASVPRSEHQLAVAQRFAITLTFENDSIATILYGSESASAVGKELIEAHCAGRSALLHDYRRLEIKGGGRSRLFRDRHQDKGHRAQLVALRRALDGIEVAGPNPLDTMAITLRALDAAGEA